MERSAELGAGAKEVFRHIHETCRARPELVRTGLAGDEHALNELATAVRSALQTTFVRDDRVLDRFLLRHYLDQLTAVERLGLLSECRVEQEQEGP